MWPKKMGHVMGHVFLTLVLARGAHAIPVTATWEPNVQLCANTTDCDSWAATQDNAISVTMPHACRTRLGPIEAIAMSLPPQNSSGTEGDLLLGCAETELGQEEIARYRVAPTLPLIATHELEPTNCVLVQLSGSTEQRNRDLKALYSELQTCGFDALRPPKYTKLMQVQGPLQKKAEKDEIIALLEEAAYEKELRMLTGADPLPGGEVLATRNTYQPGALLSAEHIARYFEEDVGLTDVSLQEFTCCGGTLARNVIARQPGVGEGADEIIVVGGHFDSLPNGAGPAPSAVDNGSGTVGVLEIARVFAQFAFNRTIEYVAFGAEEQGIHGSAHYVAVAQERGENIVAALTFDMIGYSNVFYGVTIEGTTDPAILELMENVVANTQEFGGELTIATSTNSFGSDHVSFQRAGIPAILAIEQDDTNYVCYHRECDDVSFMNYGQSLDIVRGVAGSLVDLASGQAPFKSANTTM